MMMKNKRIEKKLIRAIIIGCFANTIILIAWASLRIIPIFPKIQEFKEQFFTEEIKLNYDTYEDLKTDVDSASKRHNLIINIEDISGEEIVTNDVKYDIPLISKMVKVDSESYLLKIYFDNHTNISRSIFEILVMQCVVVIVILFITFIYTRQTILKPINILIEEIRNYKFGKKPRKRILNNEFDLISNEFSDLTDKLDEEKKEQTRIIASISHDIKTPLTSIIGYSNLLKDQNLNDESKKYNEKIYDKALNIKDILSNFDDYLLNQEKIELQKTNIQIKDIVKQLNDDYKIELENNNIEFIVKTKIPNSYISVDILKLKRIFSNMISNSARYLPDGGKIDIDIYNDNQDYKFVISDNGPGVDEKIIGKIFDPLFTTDLSRKISGLGLSICKEFIEMHGGKIEAHNNNGLTIEFTIPKSERNVKK